MNRISKSSAPCIALLLTALCGNAAEYSEVDDIPAVISVVFTESRIALKVSRDSSGYYAPYLVTYFMADRESYSFKEISEQEFLSLPADEHDAELDLNLSPTDDCANEDYPYDVGHPDASGRMILQLSSTKIEFELKCGSSISSAVSVGDSIWVGTYTAGGHGDYGSEGVLVVPKNGDSVGQLDIGTDIIISFDIDPWSEDVWVTTDKQLFRVSDTTAVLARYSLYRDFHDHRPVIRITDSPTRIENNSLAVLADWLGPTSHRTLWEASENGVQLPGVEPLYQYAMFGTYLTHQPRWPAELASALEYAQPAFNWQKFACLLPGDNAKELCTTELGEWPKDAERSLTILKNRYPNFVVTGPVYGPKGHENLRSNRHSPANFADDILFGDFDLNGVRDFAAVLIEDGAKFDPQLDKGPVGFVVVCSGTWTSHSLIQYNCTDLTDREPGGFRAELDYVDWAPWAPTLLGRSPASGDRFCPNKLQTHSFMPENRKGVKKLSIMSSYGRCDWFFYSSDKKYKGCQYCAD